MAASTCGATSCRRASWRTGCDSSPTWVPDPVIVATQRGPVAFHAEPGGGFTAHRGAGGVVSALAPLLTGKADAHWIAAASSDDDRGALRAGATTIEGLDIRLLRSEEH